jgi:stearoyl-CoA desaturase (delta-9 desaturase)
VTIWAVQMMWIPISAAGVVNGIGHYWGYRNFSCADASRNIVPWGILIGGEELHNNHHAYVTSAKLSSQWYEFDLGWMYIRALEMLGLATVRKVAPRLTFNHAKRQADLETLQSIISHRYAVLTSYTRSLKQAYAVEPTVRVWRRDPASATRSSRRNSIASCITSKGSAPTFPAVP